jgi:hypothetical protein
LVNAVVPLAVTSKPAERGEALINLTFPRPGVLVDEVSIVKIPVIVESARKPVTNSVYLVLALSNVSIDTKFAVDTLANADRICNGVSTEAIEK